MTVVGAIGPHHLACGLMFPSWRGTSFEWKVGRVPKSPSKVQASELGNILFGNPIFLTHQNLDIVSEYNYSLFFKNVFIYLFICRPRQT